ncbi:MAG: YcjX family protein [Hyphomicrobiaceae bacterium]
MSISQVSIGGMVRGMVTPTIRLGVTGLSRAGKTVLITALVRNLLSSNRLPFFSAMASGRIKAVYLEPQPDDEVPRFAYERHVEALTGDPPAWPESTKRISQLRLTFEYEPVGVWRSWSSVGRLHLDIIDYPGEWLLDLGLMEVAFEDWSARVLDRMDRPDHADIARPFLDLLKSRDPSNSYDETSAQGLADLFTAYLRTARERPPGLATLGPGRFLMPGDLEGSPLLTFAPLKVTQGGPRDLLAREFARRFEAYKAKVVQPLFKDHFARLDRQIVLVDALAGLNGGARSLQDLRDALDAALAAFRPGRAGWFGRLMGDRQIDKVLFAATKADHLPRSSHDRLEAILRLLVGEAQSRSRARGATVGVLAVAALRATSETTAHIDGEDLPCIRGVPLAGETVDGERFDGKTQAALFPGDLPPMPEQAIADANAGHWDVRFVRFAPPRLDDRDAPIEPKPWPHVRLDRALEFLLADKLM